MHARDCVCVKLPTQYVYFDTSRLGQALENVAHLPIQCASTYKSNWALVGTMVGYGLPRYSGMCREVQHHVLSLELLALPPTTEKFVMASRREFNNANRQLLENVHPDDSEVRPVLSRRGCCRPQEGTWTTGDGNEGGMETAAPDAQ